MVDELIFTEVHGARCFVRKKNPGEERPGAVGRDEPTYLMRILFAGAGTAFGRCTIRTPSS